ncbi:MAG: hypothetical protein R3D66_04455 [Alphaproteobacteria bacterium]
MKQRAEGLEKSGEKAVQSAESVRDALREQVSDISTLSGRIAGGHACD